MLFLTNLAILAMGAEGGNGSLLDVAPGLIFWTVIIFVLLLVILKKLAWGPVIKALNEREHFIKDSLDRAEKARKESDELLDQNRIALSKAEEEAQKVIAQGRELAEKLKDQILAESKTDAQKMIADAAAEIRRKNEEAFVQLKTQVAEIAIQAAEKILRENLDKQKQSELVNKFIDELPKN